MSPAPEQPAFSEFWSLRYAAGGAPLTQLFSQRIGAVCAFVASRARLSPNMVTFLGAGMFLVAAWQFVAMPDTLMSALVCLFLFQLGYGLDCADGQLARATGRTSAFGAWLDIATDYFRNLVVSAAVLLWLIRTDFAAHWIATISVFVFLVGIVVKLHTLTMLRQSVPVHGPRNGVSRFMALGMIDTVTLLALIALLRPYPVLLMVYMVSMGTLYLSLAVLQALRKLS